MTEPSTPRRIYFHGNICVICGFCFVTKETDGAGNIIVKKCTNVKLKLTKDRLQSIGKVIGSLENSDIEKNGVCVKCYRAVEKVIKLRNEVQSLTEKMKESSERVSLSLPSPRRGVSEKRLLRSPVSLQSTKIVRFPTAVSAIIPVKIEKFHDITCTSAIRPNEAFEIKPSSSDGFTMNKMQYSCVPLATSALCDVLTASQHEPRNQPTRRALFSSEEEDSYKIGKIQMIDYFQSGAKSKWIVDEYQKKYCKVLFRDQDVEDSLLKLIVSIRPQSVVSAASSLISLECEKICKRKSGGILRDKTHENIMQFTWDKLHRELQLKAPYLLKVFSAAVSPIPVSISDSKLYHALLAAAICLQGRSREMTALQYLIGFIMLHGSCTQRDIERLSKLGLSVHPQTLRIKMESWHELLDKQLLEIKNDWAQGLPTPKYQLVGDNWDRNIVPSYRTTQQKTVSVHLFNVIGVIDRVVPQQIGDDYMYILDVDDLNATDFIPSTGEQELLANEISFLVANAVINNNEQMNNLLRSIYPDHYEHAYSHLAGLKTKQFSLGLFDCDEKNTGDVIKFLKDLSEKYIPMKDDDVYEPVFFGGDRLTDERIQAAQCSMINGEKAIDRFEGFISKIEDFHRLMNFLEAIVKLTYSTGSGKDSGTAYFFRNKLNAREVKAEVKNSYRPYKMLYNTIFDAICCLLFLKEFGLTDGTQTIPVPDDFHEWLPEQKISWMCEICQKIVRKWFFEGSDLLSEVRTVLDNPEHPENYWTKSLSDGRFRCHSCDKSYVNVDSLITHEKAKHGYNESTKDTATKDLEKDDLFDYILLVFRLCALHKNLDSAVDMADGARSVRSAKYEALLYNKTGKTKYLIGSIHLTSLTSGTLSEDQTERLVQNRFINVSGGKNRNMALDEYVEFMNREIKNASTGHQTKESLIKHSKDFPFLVESVQHFDDMCDIRGRKGFHHVPSYREDVKIVVNELISIQAFEKQPGRQFQCRKLSQNRNPFFLSFKNFPLMVLRHKPSLPFRRLRNRRV